MSNPNPSPNTRFRPGDHPNPGGKPVGSKNRISAKFLADLADDYEQHGAAVIVRVREESPATYIKIIASLIPQQVELTRPFDDVSDHELAQSIAFIRAQLPQQSSSY